MVAYDGQIEGAEAGVLTSTDGQQDLPRWFQTFFAILQRIETGRIDIALPDGRVFAAHGRKPGPHGRVDVRNPEFFSRMARDGELGFCEMYHEGWYDTPDLQVLLDAVMLNNEAVARRFPGAALVRAYERLRHWLRANTERGAQRNIAHHYDLGNEFYALWLDPSMTYSSALYSGQGETLAEAQANKYAAICDRIGARPGEHVLEIGCGWGGFAEYAAAERGLHVTALTISREQHDYARKRLFEAGLSERAEVHLRDYRAETGTYDGIASIEMFEAVGEHYWAGYFNTVCERLRPGRVAALQVITVADHLWDSYRKTTDFIQKYIFPGGLLPSPQALRREAERAGLEVRGSLEFGDSYSRTLREWAERFDAQLDRVAELGFDLQFRRMWRFYLAICAACFKAGTTDVTQISLQKPL